MQINASPSALQSQAYPDAAFAPIAVDWELAFTRTPGKQAFAFWSELCAARPMPRRRDLDPRAMRSFLAHVNIIEITCPRDNTDVEYVVALQGQRALDVFGNVAQRRLSDVLPLNVEQRWRYCFELCRNAQSPVRLSSRICSGAKLWLDSESLLAPLGDAANGIDSLFLVFDCWPAPDAAVRGPPAPF